MKKSIALLIILIFLSPYLFLLSEFVTQASYANMDWSEVGVAVGHALFQSFFSSTISLVSGYVLSMGLIRAGPLSHFFEPALLIPSLLPPLVIILILSTAIPYFPFGHWGIIVIQSFIYSGMIAVSIKKMIQKKLTGSIEVALTLGAKSWQLHQLILTGLKKEILSLFVFVFIICFTSFSVPLAVGGGKATNLEVLIYEKIRISFLWDQAVLLALIQAIFLMLFSLIPNQYYSESKSIGSHLKIGNLFSYSFIFIYLGFLLISYISISLDGWAVLIRMPIFLQHFFALSLSSLGLALAVGFLVAGILIIISYAYYQPILQSFLKSYVTPSAALLGLSVGVLGWPSEMESYFRFTLAFALLVVPTLLRYQLISFMNGIFAQVQVAECYGASYFLIFKKIILPQIFPVVGHLSGLAAFWALGDFALYRLIFLRPISWSMLIDQLMGNYRLNPALALSTIVILAGGALYLFMSRMGNVFSRRLVQKI